MGLLGHLAVLGVEGRVLVKLMAGESQVNITVPHLPQFVILQFVTTIHSRVLFSSIALRPLASMMCSPGWVTWVGLLLNSRASIRTRLYGCI